MPIRAENRARYPADWPQISRRIRDRAGNRCEFCTVPNGAMIRRAVAEEVPVWRLAGDSAYENGRSAIDGSEVPRSCEDECAYDRPVRVILTVAHLDHRPENCADDNLRALCQRCHNQLDAPTRRAGTAARAKARLAACMAPPSPEPARRSGDAEPPAATATKPPLPKPPLPAGVTRNPDGSVTIREPRCPSCSPWTF